MGDFKLPERIRCLLDQDDQTGAWIGHCLDFDLVTSGESPDLAWNNLKSVVKLHIEHCFTHDQNGLDFHRAPDEDFALFEKLTNDHRLFRSDKINLNLVAPKAPDQISFWIQGAELDYAASPPFD